MFSKDELAKYADILWWGLTTARTGEYAENDVVLLRFDAEATPLAEACYERLVEHGLVPVPRMNPTPPMELCFYGRGSEGQISLVPPGDRELYENLSGVVSLIAPSSLTHLAGVDPKRIALAAISRKFLRDIMEGREQTGQLGWTLCAWPTKALAEAAGLSLDAYADQIKQACFLDDPDPVARWKEVFDSAQEVKAFLNGLDMESVRVESERCDLTVTPGKDRRWLGVSGHNLPSFEIFTSPDWRGTSGVYYADQPSYRSGNLVRGVRLEFKDGRVAASDAEEGASFLAKQLDMDEGASRLGEFSLTDRRFSRIDAFMANTLFDENFGGENGNCHVAVGASYSDTYSGDQTTLTKERKAELGYNDSALHWDLVNTESKTVTARLKDGSAKVIYENGQFAV